MSTNLGSVHLAVSDSAAILSLVVALSAIIAGVITTLFYGWVVSQRRILRRGLANVQANTRELRTAAARNTLTTYQLLRVSQLLFDAVETHSGLIHRVLAETGSLEKLPGFSSSAGTMNEGLRRAIAELMLWHPVHRHRASAARHLAQRGDDHSLVVMQSLSSVLNTEQLEVIRVAVSSLEKRLTRDDELSELRSALKIMTRE